MTHMVEVWVILALLNAGLTAVAVWARRPTWFRGLAVAGFLASFPISGFALASSLGWATPVIPLITIVGADYDVIGVKLVPEEAIYVMLDTGAEPRLYRLPWNADQASQLQGMLDNPDSGEAVLTVPGELSFDNAPSLWERPQPKLPDKLVN